MSDQVQRSADSSAILCAPTASLPEDPMHQNASGCIVSTKCEKSLTHLNAPPPDLAPACPLSEKQHSALDFLSSGYDDDYVADRLRIHRTTLYRWKHQPHFMAELHRRRQELWNDVAAD